MNPVLVSGTFDRLLLREMRFLEEAAMLGPVHVLVWSDAVARRQSNQVPKYTQAERIYLLESLRYVNQVTLCDEVDPDSGFPTRGFPTRQLQPGATWLVDPATDRPDVRRWCEQHELQYRVVPEDALVLVGKSAETTAPVAEGRTKVIVTGCYDYFHSGHVRFFEEVAEIGALFVVVGHDENIRLLKGQGHPMFPARERRYIVSSVRHVHQALISTGTGWLDAEPEMERIRPDVYAVNEDGDRPEKRDYCAAHGIEYRVLKRVPKEGLPPRQSTDLRGF